MRLLERPGVRRYFGMSRFAEVVVLALDADEVMEPLTRDDKGRTWRGRFVPIQSQWIGSFGIGWATEFERMRSRSGLLKHLESLPWPRPESVQVLIRRVSGFDALLDRREPHSVGKY